MIDGAALKIETNDAREPDEYALDGPKIDPTDFHGQWSLVLA